jgi:pyrroline-5-carboxylate reductase
MSAWMSDEVTDVMTVGILGVGNMGGAIARGYARGLEGGANVLVYDVDAAKSGKLAELPGISAAADEAELLAKADAVILAVKPQVFDEVLRRLAELPGAEPGRAQAEGPAGEAASRGKLFISIAAGVSIERMALRLGADAKIIRVMPNTPAMVGEGMSALARSASVTDAEFEKAADIFRAVGRVMEVAEDQLDAVTGISGSSPAYAYLYLQALTESGVRHGLSEEDARILAAQSTLGAAKMVLECGEESIEQMRINVCSPGGTTIEAVKTLEKEGFVDAVKRAVYACVEKSKRMRA